MSENKKDDNGAPYNKFFITPEQKELLKHLSEGLKNKEIAEAMNLSVSTVKLHISGIFICLDVCTRTAAVVKAQELGLI